LIALICDDSFTAGDILARICRKAGAGCHVASDGHEAVELCRANVYSLVFLDEVMPCYYGTDAARLIRALPPPFCSPFIVLVTSKPFEQLSVETLLVCGIDQVIRKPYYDHVPELVGKHAASLFPGA
jgi:CheY-like chemotaxis protein